MVFDYLADINWLAVAVATVAYFVLGWIWYSNALFGKQYREAIGQAEGTPPNPMAIVLNFVGWFISATTLAWIFAAIGVTEVTDGILWGAIAAVGFIAMERMVGSTYESANPRINSINAPYHALGFAAMGAILVAMS